MNTTTLPTDTNNDRSTFVGQRAAVEFAIEYSKIRGWTWLDSAESFCGALDKPEMWQA